MDKMTDKSGTRVLDLIRKDPSVTIPEMMQALGMSDSGIRKILRRLQQQGTLRRVGANKNGHWAIIK